MPITLKDGSTISCELSSWFRNATTIKKVSASPTDVIFAKLVSGEIDVPVSIKVFLDITKLPAGSSSRYYNDRAAVIGVKYEVKVYRDIISRITDGHYSPNFVRYIGYGQCPVKNVKNLGGPEITSSIENIYGPILRKYPDLPMGILITEKAGAGQPVQSLNDFWQGNPSDEDNLKVIFQIVYAVAVMQEFRLVHNDMHSANVLVVTLPAPITIFFVFDTRVFKITTRYVPKLFDWDFAFCGALGKNRKIELDNFCQDINICNRFSTKTDLYIMFCPYFKAPIGDLFGDPVTVKKEEKEIIPLPAPMLTTADIARGFTPATNPGTVYRANLSPTIPNKRSPSNNIYKMGSRQLRATFGDAWVDQYLPNVTSAMFRMYTKSMILFHGFQCRPTTFSTNIPSPLELLETQFTSLEVGRQELDTVPPQKVFTFPRDVKTKTTMFTDPLTKSTRERISKPRFPTLEGQYKHISYRKLLREEKAQYIPPNYLVVQPYLNMKMRKILFEWMNEFCEKKSVSYREYFFATRLTDLYLYKSGVELPLTKLQLLGISAIVVGSDLGDTKFYEENAVGITSDAYSIVDMEKMVAELRKFVKSTGFIVTAYEFWSIFRSKSAPIKSGIERGTTSRVELTTLIKAELDPGYLKYPLSMIAASLIALKRNTWPIDMQNLTGYSPEDLESCMKFLGKI